VVPIEFPGVATERLVKPVCLDSLNNGIALTVVLIRIDADAALPVQFDQVIERRPAHDLREGVLAWGPANLPDTLVGFSPVLADHIAEAGKQLCLISLELSAAPDEMVRRRYYLPIDVHLDLGVCSVTNSNGAGCAITGQIVQFLLPEVCPAIDVVHDLELGLGQPRGVQEPLQKRPGLVLIA
jgi:hypothetical protein